MFSEELNKLIEAALADGVITNKERTIILKRAKAEGIDPDEVEIYLDAELHKKTMQNKRNAIASFLDPFGIYKNPNMMKNQIVAAAIIGVIASVWICVGMFSGDRDKGNVQSTKVIRHYDTYQEAARAHDFEAAHKILDKMLEDYRNKEVTPYSDSWFASNKRHNKESQEKYEMEKAYEEGVEYVFDAELLYLCSLGDKESADRIVFLLSEIKVEGIPIPEGEKGESLARRSGNDSYIWSASKYNKICDKVIDLAITNQSIQIIKAILPLYKSIPSEVSSDAAVVHHSYKDKDNAIKKINKAIDDGIFPNVREHIK